MCENLQAQKKARGEEMFHGIKRKPQVPYLNLMFISILIKIKIELTYRVELYHPWIYCVLIKYTYQSILCFILVKSTNSCPIKIAHNREPRRVKFVIGWDNSEEMWKAFICEHWVSIGVGYLK